MIVKTLTFYPGKKYNSKDTGFKIPYTSEEKKLINPVINQDFFERAVTVYSSYKKVSAKVMLYQNHFYMIQELLNLYLVRGSLLKAQRQKKIYILP